MAGDLNTAAEATGLVLEGVPRNRVAPAVAHADDAGVPLAVFDYCLGAFDDTSEDVQR